MLHTNGRNSKPSATIEAKAVALVKAGRVRLSEGGASVTNDEGFIYRVDFDLGGNGPHCQCKGFEHHGYCKHLIAAQMAHDDAMWYAAELEQDAADYYEQQYAYAEMVGAGLERWTR